MEVKGIVTTKRSETVEVSTRSLMEEYERSILRHFEVPTNAYINSKGVWETWFDTGHGSGLYEEIRPATDEEKEIMKAFNKTQEILEKINK